jgi:hypothetical protein
LLCEEDGPTSAEVGSAIAWHAYRKVTAENEAARRADEEAEDESPSIEEVAVYLSGLSEDELDEELDSLSPDDLDILASAMEQFAEAAGEVPDRTRWDGGVGGDKPRKKKFGLVAEPLRTRQRKRQQPQVDTSPRIHGSTVNESLMEAAARVLQRQGSGMRGA